MELPQLGVKDGVDNKAFDIQEHGTLDNFEETGASSTVSVENAENFLKEINSPMTTEALPRLEYYRTSRRTAKRPSLGELHGQSENTKVIFFLYSVFIYKNSRKL